MYAHRLFSHELGDATFLVPVVDVGAANLTVPGGEFAISVHDGPYSELDRTYGGLGSHVMERAIGIEGPVRERGLDGLVDGSHFFDAVADDVVFEFVVSVPGSLTPR